MNSAEEYQWLYELYLAVGRGLEPEEICAEFLEILMRHKRLSFAAVWIREGDVQSSGEGGDFSLLYALPRVRARNIRLPASHPSLHLPSGQLFCQVSHTDPEFVRWIHETGVGDGAFALLKIGDFARLKLYRAGVGAAFSDRELRQLRPMVEKLAVALRGAFAYRRMVRERALLRAILDSVPDLIFFKDLQGHYRGCNAAFERFSDRSEAALIGASDADVFAPEYAAWMHDRHSRLLNARETLRHQEWVAFPNGQRVLLDTLSQPYYSPEGQLLGLVSVSRDMTDHERAEQTLAGIAQFVSEDHGEAFFPSLVTILAKVLDVDYVHVAVPGPAPGMMRVLAVIQDGQLRDLFSYALANAPCQEVMSHRRVAYSSRVRELFPLDAALQRLGAEAYVGEPIVAEDQEVLGLLAVIHRQPRSLTDRLLNILRIFSARAGMEIRRRRIELALRDSEARLARIIEAIPVPVFVKDAESRFVLINRAAEEQWGVTQRHVLGTRGEACFSSEQLQAFIDKDREVFAGGKTLRIEQEAIFLAGQDGNRVYETFKTPAFDAVGAPSYLIGVSFDITDRQDYAQKREDALKEARRLAQARSEFLANMSHEIRTPLNAVLGLARMGVMEALPGRLGEIFQRIQDSGHHLLGLINDVLDFSKIEAGKLHIAKEPFHLGEVIDQVVTMTCGPAFIKGLHFTVCEAPDLPVQLLGDGMRLAQVLVNLLANAVKFTPAGGVTLRCDWIDAVLHLSVEDTGIGMDEQQVARLFQPFEQADSTTTRRFGGTGLGLAITADLMRLMGGGAFRVDSAPGRGSRFHGQLPLPVAAGSRDLSGLPPCLCCGLEPAEASLLLAESRRWGLPVRLYRRSEPWPADHHGPWLVTTALLNDPDWREAQNDRLMAGQMLLVLAAPGQTLDDPGILSERTQTLERPLRIRQLIDRIVGPAPLAQDRSVAAGPRLRGLRLLIADDHEVNRLVVADLLEREGAELTFAEHGQQAIDIVKEQGAGFFDAVLMDVQMPVMDGYQATRHLRVLAPQLPVIGLTAHALTEERTRCLASGMIEHLTKPIDAEALVKVLLQLGQPFRPSVTAAPVASVIPAEHSAERQGADLPDCSDEPIIQWAELERRYGQRPEFITQLLTKALETQRHNPEALQTACDQHDFPRLAFLSHGIKGVAGNLMARRLRSLAANAETLARERDPSGLDAAAILIATLREFLATLQDRLDRDLTR